MSSRLWRTLQASCAIVWHVHVPKTAGTSILEALRRSPAYVNVGKQSYVHHGKSRFWLSGPDLLRRARQRLRPPWTVVSAEVGVDDLVSLQYPYFNQTCFFTVLRDPRAWVSSAENHMRLSGAYTGGLRGTYGYFDRPNIQSNMAGYRYDAAMQTSDPRPSASCVATLEGARVSILPHLFGHSSPRPLHLSHANARAHDTNVSAAELTSVVAQKYAVDERLWKLVDAQQVVCW